MVLQIMTKFQDETTRGEQWPLENIIPYEKNAKKHPKEQIKMLSRAIDEMGWRYRILVDENGVIIAGHGRLAVAKYRNQKTAPVTVITDLSPKKVRELRLADNKVVSNDYDVRLLTDEWRELMSEEESDLTWLYDERELDFGLEDNGEINDFALSEGLGDEFDDHAESTMELIDDREKAEVMLSKVFSFTKVSGAQARQLKLLEKYAEGETGLSGAEALSALSKNLLSA